MRLKQKKRDAIIQAACELFAPGASLFQFGSRWANIVMSNVKRVLDGTYHMFCFLKYADHYLAKAMYRFNLCLQMQAMMPRLLVAAARCPPWAES